MNAYKKLQRLSKKLGKVHNWEGGAGMVEIWIDSQCCPHIHIQYNVIGDDLHTDPKIFHTLEPIGDHLTLDQAADRFCKECMEGLET